MTGEAVATASAGFDTQFTNQPIVSLDLTGDGAQLFADITRAHVNERLAIVLDDVVRMAPNINQPIANGQARIEGFESVEEARDIAIVLRAGALPAPLQIIEERTVDPSLGADSIRSAKIAGLLGVIGVVAFMIFYYRGSGLVADIALVLNVVLILAALAAFGATLTLPGIAGLILTIGMAVDANVLVFERVREELAHRQDRSSRSRHGLRPRPGDDSRLPDHDAHRRRRPVPVRHGAHQGVRGRPLDRHPLLDLHGGIRDAHDLPHVVEQVLADEVEHMIWLFKDANYPFLRYKNWGYAISIGLTLLALAVVLVRGGLKYSIDFTGGTLVQLEFDEPVESQALREALADMEGLTSSEVQRFGDVNDFVVRAQVPPGAGTRLSRPDRVPSPRCSAAGGQGVPGGQDRGRGAEDRR